MEPPQSDHAPTVVVGVGAGIAAYKVVQVVRDLQRAGCVVRVVPTPRSLGFVGIDTWRAIGDGPVETSVFTENESGHVALAREADLFVLAPATADLLARARLGIVDDLLTATLLASNAPVIAFPAMHTNMWRNAATADNVKELRNRGWIVVDPDSGELSSGDSGKGRLPEPAIIVHHCLELLDRLKEKPEAAGNDLAGTTVLITAGGTQEPLDPVRFIGNRSTGAMGVALANNAANRGANVLLVAGSVEVDLPESHPRITVQRALSAKEMHAAVLDALGTSDALIMCAAVGDFAPKKVASKKIKKSDSTSGFSLELQENPDILADVSKSEQRPSVLVGFGAETGTVEEVRGLGAQKAVSKGADLLVVNRVGEGQGFGDVDSQFYYFDAEGAQTGSASGSKPSLANDLLDRVAALLEKRLLV